MCELSPDHSIRSPANRDQIRHGQVIVREKGSVTIFSFSFSFHLFFLFQERSFSAPFHVGLSEIRGQPHETICISIYSLPSVHWRRNTLVRTRIRVRASERWIVHIVFQLNLLDPSQQFINPAYDFSVTWRSTLAWRRIPPIPACSPGSSTRARGSWLSRSRRQRASPGSNRRWCTLGRNTAWRTDWSRPIGKRPARPRTGRRARCHCPCPGGPSSSAWRRGRGSCRSRNRSAGARSWSRTYGCCSGRWKSSRYCRLSVEGEPGRERPFELRRWQPPVAEPRGDLDPGSRRRRGSLSRRRPTRRQTLARPGYNRTPGTAVEMSRSSARSGLRFSPAAGGRIGVNTNVWQMLAMDTCKY